MSSIRYKMKEKLVGQSLLYYCVLFFPISVLLLSSFLTFRSLSLSLTRLAISYSILFYSYPILFYFYSLLLYVSFIFFLFYIFRSGSAII